MADILKLQCMVGAPVVLYSSTRRTQHSIAGLNAALHTKACRVAGWWRPVSERDDLKLLHTI